MRACLLVVCGITLSMSAFAQGVLSDVMSGKLVNPEVGVFAWYELTDADTGQRLFMRQAIVGKKQVAGKPGYYLETEVMPEIGFPIIYRMLLTGPATTPDNVHEILVKDGTQPVVTLPADLLEEGFDDPPQQTRESQGIEVVSTSAGDMEAEHFIIHQGDSTTELWVNDKVRPMGIVKMTSDEGTLVLSRHGIGGPDAESAIDRKSREQHEDDIRVRTTTPGPTKNFSGKSDAD